MDPRFCDQVMPPRDDGSPSAARQAPKPPPSPPTSAGPQGVEHKKTRTHLRRGGWSTCRDHPLLPDAETRMKKIRAFMDGNGGRLRRMTRAKAAARSLPDWNVFYVVGR